MAGRLEADDTGAVRGLSAEQGRGRLFIPGGSGDKRAGTDKFGKKYFKNLAELEREKSRLRDWEHSNRTQRDWQTLAERAHIGQQEFERLPGNLSGVIEAVGNRSISHTGTAGGRFALGAGKPAKEDTPEGPTAPEAPTPVADVPDKPKRVKERTPSVREIQAGVTEWKRTGGESGISHEEAINLGNVVYNRKAAAPGAIAKDTRVQSQFSGVSDAPKEA